MGTQLWEAAMHFPEMGCQVAQEGAFFSSIYHEGSSSIRWRRVRRRRRKQSSDAESRRRSRHHRAWLEPSWEPPCWKMDSVWEAREMSDENKNAGKAWSKRPRGVNWLPWKSDSSLRLHVGVCQPPRPCSAEPPLLRLPNAPKSHTGVSSHYVIGTDRDTTRRPAWLVLPAYRLICNLFTAPSFKRERYVQQPRGGTHCAYGLVPIGTRCRCPGNIDLSEKPIVSRYWPASIGFLPKGAVPTPHAAKRVAYRGNAGWPVWGGNMHFLSEGGLLLDTSSFGLPTLPCSVLSILLSQLASCRPGL